MSKTEKVTFKANEENLQQMLVNAFKETKNIGWLVELLLCYDENVQLLENLGLNIDEIKSFTKLKRSKKAKVTFSGVKLLRKKYITDADFVKIESLVKNLRENYATKN